MNSQLKIVNIAKNKNRIEITYTANGKWNILLNIKEKFFAEYDMDIEDVPNSISVIPFLCNIIQIAWVFDLDILIDELDEEFYNCLNEVKLGYSNMYPKIEMKGRILVNKLIKNEYIPEKSAMFFSGRCRCI